MSRQEVAERVRSLLRRSAFLGQDREVHEQETLLRLGGGLDSLALVEFLTAVEVDFDVDLPDEVWTAAGGATLGDVIDHLDGLGSGHRGEDREGPPLRGRNAVSVAGDGGWISRAWDFAGRAGARILRPVYEGMSWAVLLRDLTEPIPPVAGPLDTSVRVAGGDLAASLASWEPAGQRGYVQRLVDRRRDAGHVCLVAWTLGELSGLDWIVTTRYVDPVSGLTLEMTPGSCLGLDLRENERHQARGVGLALLTESLHEARRLGYERQVTLVLCSNTPMLVTAGQLLGYREVGRVRTHRALRRTLAHWRMGTRAGWGVLRI